jgi:hypothetical protein
MTKIKIALTAVLFAVTSSAAFAQGQDPNPANRYPSYAEANTYGYVGHKLQRMEATPAGTRALRSTPARQQEQQNVRLQSAPVLQQRAVALPSEPAQGSSAGPIWHNGSGPTSGGM